jgi:hypothetical protein
MMHLLTACWLNHLLTLTSRRYDRVNAQKWYATTFSSSLTG